MSYVEESEDPYEMFLDLMRERPPTPWASQGACRGLDPDLFFPERGHTHQASLAKQVCASCPVQKECLDYGREYERFGIWGGETYRDFLKGKREAKVRFAA